MPSSSHIIPAARHSIAAESANILPQLLEKEQVGGRDRGVPISEDKPSTPTPVETARGKKKIRAGKIAADQIDTGL